jgi:hypothetical protein
MKTYTCKEANLSFVYPDNWAVEQEKNLISVFANEDGVGALQFSYYQVESPENLRLQDELEEYILKRHSGVEAICSRDFAFSNYLEGASKRYWKYWLFLRANVLVFGSYNCQENDIGKEDERVDKIVTSAIEGNVD